MIWNRLPISLRENVRPNTFKIELIKYLWKNDINDKYINHTFEAIDNHGFFALNLDYLTVTKLNGFIKLKSIIGTIPRILTLLISLYLN